jgi:hypothetical protein
MNVLSGGTKVTLRTEENMIAERVRGVGADDSCYRPRSSAQSNVTNKSPTSASMVGEKCANGA